MKAIKNLFKKIWHRKTMKAAVSLTGKRIAFEGLTPDMMVAVKVSRQRADMLAKFLTTKRQCSGLMKKTMAIGYEQAINDVITLLVPDAKPSLVARAKAALMGKPKTKELPAPKAA
jgi:hypothetical protein